MNVDSGCVISGQAKPCGRTITCRMHWEGCAAAALVPETVHSAATSGMWKEGGLLVSVGDRHHGPWEREVEVDAVHVRYSTVHARPPHDGSLPWLLTPVGMGRWGR